MIGLIETHVGWVLALIYMLWLMGGIGWMFAYEKGEGQEQSLLFRCIIIVFFPAFIAAALVHQVYTSIKSAGHE